MFAAVQRTASIIGVEVTNPGARYTSEPIVTFDDECQKGEGAYGKATIDQNPKSQLQLFLQMLTVQLYLCYSLKKSIL